VGASIGRGGADGRSNEGPHFGLHSEEQKVVVATSKAWAQDVISGFSREVGDDGCHDTRPCLILYRCASLVVFCCFFLVASVCMIDIRHFGNLSKWNKLRQYASF
jgi:hypothetical protein